MIINEKLDIEMKTKSWNECSYFVLSNKFFHIVCTKFLDIDTFLKYNPTS